MAMKKRRTVIPLMAAAALLTVSTRGSRAATFLDTLNKGREVSITAADIGAQSAPVPAPAPAIVPVPAPAAAPDTFAGRPSGEPKREAGVVPSRFRVQILASTQEQQVREEKNNVAAKIKLADIDLPVTVVFEAPYYKLLAGDFAQRSEAENCCAQLKKIGYNDAWIVRTASPQR
ncbi:MAG: SPOR domain-containing protein [Chitinispirillaceae bacterium]